MDSSFVDTTNAYMSTIPNSPLEEIKKIAPEVIGMITPKMINNVTSEIQPVISRSIRAVMKKTLHDIGLPTLIAGLILVSLVLSGIYNIIDSGILYFDPKYRMAINICIIIIPLAILWKMNDISIIE